MIEETIDFESEVAQVTQQNLIQPALHKRNSFNQDTIRDWSILQDHLQLEFSILQKENETKQERIQILQNTLTQYFKTLLRYKDLRFKELKQCTLGLSFGDQDLHLSNLINLLMNNQQLFAQIIHSSLDSTTKGIDDFIFNLFTFVFDPIVGAGMEDGVFKFLSELLSIEIGNLRSPNELFDPKNIVCKFLLGATKGPQSQAFLSSVLGQALNLLINVKETLEINPRTVYENLQIQREQKEMMQNRQNNDERRRKNMIQKIQDFILGNQEQDNHISEMTIYDVKDSFIEPDKLKYIIQQITPAIQSYCQTPLGRMADSQLVENTAKILYERRQATEIIINSLCDNIFTSLNRVPFIIRAIANIMITLLKAHFTYLSPFEVNQILAQFIVNKWIVSEFTIMFMNSFNQSEPHSIGMSNIHIISKLLTAIWKCDYKDILNDQNQQAEVKINITYNQIQRYFTDIINLPSTQFQYYLKPKKDKHIFSCLLSLQDVDILVHTIQKSRIELSLSQQQLIPYRDIKKLSENIVELLKIDKFRKTHPNQHHFHLTKFSDLYNVNYTDIAFKFTDLQKIKELPKAQQEEQLFISKAKQVVAQFLISIEKISQLTKQRNNVILTFDNLIYLYKDAYENKGVAIKQYENISPQLYANYLLSIYKMIPEHYTSNNLNLLCYEMQNEFDLRVKLAKTSQKTLTEVYIRILTQLQNEREEVKIHNKIIKKQNLQKQVNNFLKNLKLPCSLLFNKGSIIMSIVKEGSKFKTLEPKDYEKQQFLKMLNQSDIKQVTLEIGFSTLRDFVDLIAGMKLFNEALEGDEQAKSIVKNIYDQYMGFLEERMKAKNFYPAVETRSEKIKNRVQYYNHLCQSWLEKSIVRRIMLKQEFKIKIDSEFYEKCQQKKDLSLEEHGLQSCEQEIPILNKLSEQLTQFDKAVTHLEKLECIQDCQNNIINFLSISGMGSNQGQDVILPIFIYLMILSSPRYMMKNKNLIEIFYNPNRWKSLNQTYYYAYTQLISAFEAIK